MSTAFGEWLQLVYCKCPIPPQPAHFSHIDVADEEKNRRQGYSTRSPTPLDQPARTTPRDSSPTTQTTPAGPQPTAPTEPQPTTSTEPQPTTPAEPQPTTPAEPQPATPEELTPAVPNERRGSALNPSPSTPPLVSPRLSPVITPSLTPGASRSFEHAQSYPDFITTSIIEYLNSIDGGPRWVEMVRSYLELESQHRSRVSYSLIYRLPTNQEQPSVWENFLCNNAPKRLLSGAANEPVCLLSPTPHGSVKIGFPGGVAASRSGGLPKRGRIPVVISGMRTGSA